MCSLQASAKFRFSKKESVANLASLGSLTANFGLGLSWNARMRRPNLYNSPATIRTGEFSPNKDHCGRPNLPERSSNSGAGVNFPFITQPCHGILTLQIFPLSQIYYCQGSCTGWKCLLERLIQQLDHVVQRERAAVGNAVHRITDWHTSDRLKCDDQTRLVAGTVGPGRRRSVAAIPGKYVPRRI
jgi:hypothetical protein